jgi:hypothetical protein
MGREFARFSAELSETFDLSNGLNTESPGVSSANFHGPKGSSTDITNSFASLNAIASNNTRYTIIDIPEAIATPVTSGSKIIAHGVVGQGPSGDTLVNATVSNRWKSGLAQSTMYVDITVPSSANATVLATAENSFGLMAAVSVRNLGSNKYRFTTNSGQKKIYFAFIKG